MNALERSIDIKIITWTPTRSHEIPLTNGPLILPFFALFFFASLYICEMSNLQDIVMIVTNMLSYLLTFLSRQQSDVPPRNGSVAIYRDILPGTDWETVQRRSWSQAWTTCRLKTIAPRFHADPKSLWLLRDIRRLLASFALKKIKK